MATKKISGMDPITTLLGTELIEIVQGGNSKRTTLYYVNPPIRTGFVNQTDATISLSSRNFTISPSGASFDYWIGGVNYIISAPKNITIAATNGIHTIYFDTDGELHEEVYATLADFYEVYDSIAIVSSVGWSNSDNAHFYWSDDRHNQGNACQHALGAQIVKGSGSVSRMRFGPFSPNIYIDPVTGEFGQGDGSLASHAQVGFEAGLLSVNSKILSIPATASSDAIPILYRYGITGEWRRVITNIGSNNYPLIVTGTGRMAINFSTVSTYPPPTPSYPPPAEDWGLYELPSPGYAPVYFFATNDKEYKIVGVADQYCPNLPFLNVVGLPTQMAAICGIWFETNNAYANEAKTRTVFIRDFRNFSNTFSATASEWVTPYSMQGWSI